MEQLCNTAGPMYKSKDKKHVVVLLLVPGATSRDLSAKASKSDLYVAVCPGEVGQGQFTGHKNSFTLGDLIARVCKVDGEKSVSGLV